MNKLKKMFLEMGTATIIGATALTGCAKGTNDTPNRANISSSFEINKTYSFTLNGENFILTEEEYKEFLNELKKAAKDYNAMVSSNGSVKIERNYTITLAGKTVVLTESEFENLVNQLVDKNTIIEISTEEYTEGSTEESKESESTEESTEESKESESTEESTEYVYEELTTENYENLVANYAIYLQNKGIVAVGTEDVAKFAAVTNIDILAEDNPDIIVGYKEENKTREEFLNDGAKVIGALVMNNFLVWNSTSSTADFARVSGVVFGEQRNQMLKIEDYQDRIADAVNAKDGALVNQIVAEFLTDMNSGTLSKLDDGVGFAAQVCIATISDGIAKDYLNQENFDMFQILKTSEKYVANIFTVYEECGSHRSR